MAEDSKIEWTHHTFNPWRGCTKVSAGCANCYAETLSSRNPDTLGVWGPKGTRVVAAEGQWSQPVRWNREAKAKGERHRVFCASLADVFEDWTRPMHWSDGGVLHACAECGKWRTMESMCHGPNAHLAITMQDVRARLFRLIGATPNLDWLLLTKRPENVMRMMPEFHPCGMSGCEVLHIRPNVWIGTSVENQQAADERIPHLLKVPAAVRFLSMEPLLGPVDVQEWLGDAMVVNPDGSLFRKGRGVDWVIVGGESGPDARSFDLAWARDLRDQCAAAGVPFFFKQMGENVVNFNGLLRVRFRDKGGNLTDIPADLRIRQFPEVIS